MSPTTIQRTIWLAAITLIVAVAALAFARRSGSGHPPIPGAVGPYYTSRAAPYGPSASRRTACGETFTSKLQGIAHPTLPCGVKVYILFRGHEVLTEVPPPTRTVDVVVVEPEGFRGFLAAKVLRERFPTLPIICASIAPPSARTAELRPLAYLQKPFTLGELKRELARALPASSSSAA